MRLPLVIGASVVGRGYAPDAGFRSRRGRSPDLRLRCLQCVEHGLGMAGDLDLATGPRDAALRVDQEGAALDAHDLAPVPVLLVDTVRAEERRVGQECVRTCRSRGGRCIYKKKKN